MTHSKWRRASLIIKTSLRLICTFEIETAICLWATFDFKLRYKYSTFYILTHSTLFLSSFMHNLLLRDRPQKACISKLFSHPFDFQIIWTCVIHNERLKPIRKAIICTIKLCFTNMKKKLLKSYLMRTINEDLLEIDFITSMVIDPLSTEFVHLL